MNNDLISRSALKEQIDSVQYTKEFCIEHQIDYSISMQMLRLVIDNAPTVEPESSKMLIDNVKVQITEEEKQRIIKMLREARPTLLKIEPERPQGDLAEKLKDRIEESVCKYCQMNKHCEICEISRVFQIITLTVEDMKTSD